MCFRFSHQNFGTQSIYDIHGFIVSAALGSTLTCVAEGNAIDVNDAAPDHPVVFALRDACTAIMLR